MPITNPSRQPQLNLQIAKAYLAGSDPGVSAPTWQHALDAIVKTKHGSTQDRWRRAAKEAALDLIPDRVIIETQAEHLLASLKAGTTSTNVHLRKLHKLLPFDELASPAALIRKRLWPEVRRSSPPLLPPRYVGRGCPQKAEFL